MGLDPRVSSVEVVPSGEYRFGGDFFGLVPAPAPGFLMSVPPFNGFSTSKPWSPVRTLVPPCAFGWHLHHRRRCRDRLADGDRGWDRLPIAQAKHRPELQRRLMASDNGDDGDRRRAREFLRLPEVRGGRDRIRVRQVHGDTIDFKRRFSRSRVVKLLLGEPASVASCDQKKRPDFDRNVNGGRRVRHVLYYLLDNTSRKRPGPAVLRSKSVHQTQ
jgi:hypothetical protein